MSSPPNENDNDRAVYDINGIAVGTVSEIYSEDSYRGSINIATSDDIPTICGVNSFASKYRGKTI